MEDGREWKPRKIGVNIGRLTYIPLGSGELYHLRTLLNYKKGVVIMITSRLLME